MSRKRQPKEKILLKKSPPILFFITTALGLGLYGIIAYNISLFFSTEKTIQFLAVALLVVASGFYGSFLGGLMYGAYGIRKRGLLLTTVIIFAVLIGAADITALLFGLTRFFPGYEKTARLLLFGSTSLIVFIIIAIRSSHEYSGCDNCGAANSMKFSHSRVVGKKTYNKFQHHTEEKQTHNIYETDEYYCKHLVGQVETTRPAYDEYLGKFEETRSNDTYCCCVCGHAVDKTSYSERRADDTLRV